VAEPLVSGQAAVYVLLALMVGPLVLLGVLSASNFWRARRARRELENDFLLRIAMDDAQRLGMLPEDIK
jgi:hypothetical protein